MLYRQTEARLIRGIGLGVWFALSSYIGYSVYGALVGVESVTPVVAYGIFAATVAVLLACGFYALFVNRKSSEFFIEVDKEVHEVRWPDADRVKTATWQVIILTIFFVLFLAAVDFFLMEFREVIL